MTAKKRRATIDIPDVIDLPGSFLDGLRLSPDGKAALVKQAQYFDDIDADSAAEDAEAEADAWQADEDAKPCKR